MRLPGRAPSSSCCLKMAFMVTGSPGIKWSKGSMDNKLLCRETIPGFLEPLLGEGENPCQLLEQLEDDGEEWEAWYQKYYAQVLHNAFILSLSTAQ